METNGIDQTVQQKDNLKQLNRYCACICRNSQEQSSVHKVSQDVHSWCTQFEIIKINGLCVWGECSRRIRGQLHYKRSSAYQFSESHPIQSKMSLQGPLQQRLPLPFRWQLTILFKRLDSLYLHYPMQKIPINEYF